MESDTDNDSSGDNSDWEVSSESDSEPDTTESPGIWYRLCNEKLESPPPRFPFTGNPGMTVSVQPSDDPLAYFNLFFDDEIIEHIVVETNRFASQYLENAESHLLPNSRARSWGDTNAKEMKLILAMMFLQGIIQKPTEKWMWNKRPVLETPIFGKLMSEKRYSLIMKFLHFEKDEAIDKTNHSNPKGCKIFTLNEKLIQRFQSVYIPERDLTVSDSLITYCGLTGWKQCIPNKSWLGVKLFQLCESKTGYIWNSLIYAGKETPFLEAYSSYKLPTRTVLHLMHKLLGKGYFVTADETYTSPELALALVDRGTDICGAVKNHRSDLPPNMKEPMAKGEVFAFQKGKMCVVKWNDKKKVIIMLSTIHNNETKTVRQKSSVKTKPVVVLDYTQKMNERADQCLSYYSVVQNQQRKYYKKIFQHLLNQAAWNAFILYKKNNEHLTHVEFRLRLIERIIEENCIKMREPNKASCSYPNITRLMGRHFPTYVNTTGKPRSRKCVVCAKLRTENGKSLRRETRFQCEECLVGLCVVPCFKIYHTESEL